MANASYCRFQNTLRDLRDCSEALDDEEHRGISIEEQDAVKKLISLCGEISAEYSDVHIDFDRDGDDELLDEEDEEDEEDEDGDNDIFNHQPPAFLFKTR